MTARVSGEASGLRATDCSALPDRPSAVPTSSAASTRGARDATSTARASSSPDPVSRPEQVPDADGRGAERQVDDREHDHRDDRGDEHRDDRARPGRGGTGAGPAAPSAAGPASAITLMLVRQAVRAATVASMNAAADSGPPNIQMPSGSRVVWPATTKGSCSQIALPVRPSLNASPPSVSLPT